MRSTIGLISLGCGKNQVNSEQMLWLIKNAGYEITSDIEKADIVIVNTCGFIESAKSEAIETILSLAEYKEMGRLKKIIATGCLTERYKQLVMDEMPEVDGILGCGSFDEIVEAVKAVEKNEKPRFFGEINAPISETERIVSTQPWWAYLKIADGCDNCCAYCVIPSLRGKYRSRPMEQIVREAERLADKGIKELLIIAQDITRYGTDIGNQRLLVPLLGKLCAVPGIEWIRLHYLYPDEIDDELIALIAEEPKILKYLDIPIQHINDRILKRMNRRGTGEEIRLLFKKLRDRIPQLVIRSSIIAGLPGEGEDEFEELCAFLKEARIERAGVFSYSPEEGTPAAEMPDQVSEDVARRRAALITDIQSAIIDAFNESRIGTVLRVLCEGTDSETFLMTGRSWAESPEIDGRILFTPKNARAGEFTNVLITKTCDGELFGEEI